MKIFSVTGRVVLACTLAAALPVAATAQDSTPSTGVFKTAQQLYDMCTSDDETDVEMCDWFIMSAHDMMKFYGDTDMGGSEICLPMGTKELDVRNAVLSYLQGRSGSMGYSAVSTIYNALTAAYPC